MTKRTSYTYEEKHFPYASTEAEECLRHGYVLSDRTLGSGAYAKVKLAQAMESKFDRNAKLAYDLKKKDHNMVAIKIISRKDAPSEYIHKFLPREIEAMKSTYRHENLIQLYDTFHSDLRVYLVMEFAAGGDLLEFINNTSMKNGLGGIGEEMSRKMFRQLVLGIAHCHQLNVVHRDLKCENILLDEYNNVKITDFGFAVRVPNHNKSHLLKTFCGSYAYAAPEILNATHYDGKLADVWSLGVILFAMVNGKLPFNDNNLKTLLEQTRQKLEFKPWITHDCQELVRKLLRVKPLSRLKINDILRHSWMTRGRPKSPRLQKLLKFTEACRISPEDMSIEDIEDNVEDFQSDHNDLISRKTPSLRMYKAPGTGRKIALSPVKQVNTAAHCQDLVLNGENALRYSKSKSTQEGAVPSDSNTTDTLKKKTQPKQKPRYTLSKLLQQKKKSANEVRDRKILDVKAAGESLTAKSVYSKQTKGTLPGSQNNAKEQKKEKRRREMRRKLLGIPMLYGDYKDYLKPKQYEKAAMSLGPLHGLGAMSQRGNLSHAEARVGLPNIGTGVPLPALPPALKEKFKEEPVTMSFRYKYSKEKKQDESKDPPSKSQQKMKNANRKSQSQQDSFMRRRAKQALENHCKSLTEIL
ncbi:serine/threonine-protein kinase MARK2-like [Ptychodera flava]|uniref:serine/threonine-protein kinase MARK2-like n=1 Tax=Ptychodera flava TaxID=63121 RepID=UPI00396A344D